jgi:uncharacterized protein YjiS (DUF1127 family)
VQPLFAAFAPAAPLCRTEANRRRTMTMTAISSTAGQPASRNLPTGLFRALGSLVNGIVTYFAHREAIKTLSELDDRALRDIGIERSRIESAVHCGVDPEFGRIR